MPAERRPGWGSGRSSKEEVAAQLPDRWPLRPDAREPLCPDLGQVVNVPRKKNAHFVVEQSFSVIAMTIFVERKKRIFAHLLAYWRNVWMHM